MSNRNPRADEGRPVERTRVTPKQRRTPDVAPRDERDEDVVVGPGDPVAYDRDVDVAPVRDERDVDVAPVRDERGEDLGPDDPIRFEDADAVPTRETESVAPAPTVVAGMFLPVIILTVVAIILILWFLL